MRGLSNRAHVIVRGMYAPVVGRVSMDLTLIDVTNVSGVEVDDQVTLLGWDRQNAELKIVAEDLALRQIQQEALPIRRHIHAYPVPLTPTASNNSRTRSTLIWPAKTDTSAAAHCCCRVL